MEATGCPAMNEAPVTWLVVNPSSGSNDEAAVVALRAELTIAGHAPQRIVEVPDEPAPDRAALEQAGVGLLVVFAGDGTASRTLTALYGWEGQVLVLPGGTQNLLACSLHGDSPVTEIVAGLKARRLRRVERSLVRCSAGDALCEIVAGPGAIWSDVRETMREGAIGEIAAAAREAIGQSAAGPMVTLAEPALGKPEGYPAIRLCPGANRSMTVDGYGADRLLDYALQGVALLKRDFRQGPHDELGDHTSVTCRSEAPIDLMIDGERATGGTVERFALLPCDLAFLGGRVEPASGARDA